MKNHGMYGISVSAVRSNLAVSDEDNGSYNSTHILNPIYFEHPPGIPYGFTFPLPLNPPCPL